jgi:zinc protease
MVFTRRTLANGLELIAQPSPGGGSVAVQVWYRVGGKDDPLGRSGFAHLFEHLMFKSTRFMANEQFDRLTEDVGGQNNAFTAEDVTAYSCTVPSHHLERILWAEAERMSNLNVDEGNFKSERLVVQEEFRQRVLANPYGRLFEGISPAAWAAHPYKNGVIGSIEQLDAASLDDVRAFHATYYRPDNAILIVSGDFSPAALDTAVDRYFGPLQHPASPIPRIKVAEPVRLRPRTMALTGPNVPLPAALMIWQGVSADASDAAALEVAQALLAGGDSSRLNQALVYRQRAAQTAGFDARLLAQGGALIAYAIAAGKRSPQSLVLPLMNELAELANRPIPADELEKVKTQLLTAALNERQTALGRGTSLGWAMIHDNDPEAVNRDLQKLQAVSAADVQRALRAHVIGKPAVTVFYTQEAK